VKDSGEEQKFRERILIDGNLGIGIFQDYYQSGPLSNLSPSTISWILSLEVFFMFLGVCVTR
jgi:hypothetical protein